MGNTSARKRLPLRSAIRVSCVGVEARFQPCRHGVPGLLRNDPKFGAVVAKDLFLGPHRYTVTVELRLSAPFVADGRMSLADFAFQMVFQDVRPGFEPAGDAVLGCCYLESQGGRGSITELELNDVLRDGEVALPVLA